MRQGDAEADVAATCDAAMFDARYIMHADDVTTPLRHLYFCVQVVLIDPDNVDEVRPIIDESLRNAGRVYQDSSLAPGLREVGGLLELDRYLDALVALKAMFAKEQGLHGKAPAAGLDVRQ